MSDPSLSDGVAECIRVRLAGVEDEEGWEAFVAQSAKATFFHRFGWQRIVTRGLGHTPWFLLAERAGVIEGILPLAEVRTWFFGHRLIALPGCVYGGVVATTDGARKMLVQEASRLAHRLKVDALELRNRAVEEPEWPRSDLYYTFRKDISDDSEVNLKAIPRKQRAMVRKGIQAGLRSVLTEDLKRFYRLYALSVRNLGTPVFSRRFFRSVIEEFSDATEICIVQHEGRDVAAVMSFYFRDEVLPYFAGSGAAARGRRANDFMYWDLMCRAAEKGVRVFDFGRSKQGTGAFDFKKNWGFLPQPLAYEYALVRAKSIPSINPSNPKYGVFIAAWKRLPLPIANAIGPFLARNLS